MPIVKEDWVRTPKAYVFNGLHVLGTLKVASVSANAANTTAQDWFPLPTSVKVCKVAISFTAANAVTGHLVNICYNTTATPNIAAAETAVTANDNSDTGPGTATVQGGTGIWTNGAIDGSVLFTSDLLLSTVLFPGMTTTNGGIASFVPTNYDAVYPAGPVPNSAGVLTQVNGYFTLRVVTPASTGSLTNLVVTLLGECVTSRATYSPPSNPQPVPLPGTSF